MNLRMWTYDLAREQAPTLDHLRRLCEASLEGGYTSLGIYLEHRFEYPSARWAAGRGAVSPDMIAKIEQEFPALDIVPFVNLLGHMEGFLYTEGGEGLAEERFAGLQGCPSQPAFQELARNLLADVLQCFRSPLVHLGGDETAALGRCPLCAERVANHELSEGVDGRAALFTEHYLPLIEMVLESGKRPAIWADMLAAHPQVLDSLPRQTLLFDWQYFESPRQTCERLKARGFDVVACPALHTYNSAWLHVAESEINLREHLQVAQDLDLAGVCLTTWEGGLFGSYEALLPAMIGAGVMMQGSGDLLDRYPPDARDWAELMGVSLPACGPPFEFSRTRNAFKCRLLLYGNPFLLWLRHREELCGIGGDQAWKVADEAAARAPDAGYRGVSEFVRGGIEFVRHAEAARSAYRSRRPGEATTALIPARQTFENLQKIAEANRLRSGGSLADPQRCRIAREHVERVILRIKEFGDGSLGYLPSFETITHPKFVPHDQANWWLINRWANE